MPIQVSTFQTKPAVALNRVHCVELRINITEEQDPKARVRIVTKLYGHDAEGIKHFAPEQGVLLIDDAYTEAAANAEQGNFALAQALGAIEAAVASLIQQTGDYGNATVV